jgi:hypothetical protein
VVSGGTQRYKLDTDWFDPVIGLRVAGDLSEKWYLALSGDVGGFSIGSASDLTWQAMLVLGWRFGEHWSAQLGWRALDIQRSRGGTGSKVELLLHGPLLAATYRF